MSTPIPTCIPQAACKHKKPIFGPTPGKISSSSIVLGTSPSNWRIAQFSSISGNHSSRTCRKPTLSRMISALLRMYSVLRRQKPTLLMQACVNSGVDYHARTENGKHTNLYVCIGCCQYTLQRKTTRQIPPEVHDSFVCHGVFCLTREHK